MVWAYQEAQAQLSNEAFLEWCADNDLDPRDESGVDKFSRADKCSQPVVLETASLETGEVGLTPPLVLPCGSPNADVCASCAEFLQRLRNRQILDTLEQPATRTALLTLTAPSWGKVHRAFWTDKDTFRYRSLSEVEIYRKKLLKMKQQGHCPCGDFHEYTDGLVGTPIDRSTYDYAGEVIWSKNLPNLMAAAVRQIKRLALASDIEPSELRLFSVYERQKRGSLHSHVLIAVTGNEQGFIRLASTIAKSWSSPTAEIPAGLVANYESTIVKSRLITSGLNANVRVPTAKWKNRIEHPATKFGKQYDFRILKADSETDTEIRSYKQASSYVSKYLTKNQSAFAPVALKRLSAQQKRHFYDLRKTAMALLADYSLYVARVRTLERQRRAMFEVASEQLAFIQAELKQLRSRGIERSGIVDTLFDEWVTSTVTREGLKQTFDDLASLIGDQMSDEQVTLLSLISEAQEVEATVSLRSIKISLNRLANNAGFTGSLTIVSNWRKSISDLKQEMAVFRAEQMVDVQEPAVIAVELNIEKMSELRRERAKYSERNKSVIERTILWASNLKQKSSPIII